MQFRTIAYWLIAVTSMAAIATAQQYPPSGGYPPTSGGNVQPGQPDQPVQPQDPTLVRRAPRPDMPQPGMQRPVPPPLPPGFPLTQQEQGEVDQVLVLWEKRNRDVKTFDCRFERWVYDTVFGKPDEARFVELGVLRYSAPDKGMFRVDTSVINRQETPDRPAPRRALDLGRQIDHRVRSRKKAGNHA